MVTLQRVKDHLRIVGDEEDEYLVHLIDAARVSIEKDLRRTFEGEVPPPVQHAALLLIGHWYAHREDVVPGAMTELPRASRALLSPYRRLVG